MKMSTQKIKQLFFLVLFAVGTTLPCSAVEKVTYLHNNELGSPVAATDSTGAVIWTESYRPYGERVEYTNNDTNDTWYTGKQHDADIGLSYYGARWYDPNVGRFTGIDPVGVQEDNVHSFNRYAYANNNPYKFVDPDGEESVTLTATYSGFVGSLELGLDTPGGSGLPFFRLKFGVGKGAGAAYNPNGKLPRADSVNQTDKASSLGVSADVVATITILNMGVTSELLLSQTQDAYGNISTGRTDPTPKFQEPTFELDKPVGVRGSASVNLIDISSTIPGVGHRRYDDQIKPPNNYAATQN